MVGELRCLNCSRHLADVVDGGSGSPRLSPPAGRTSAPILVERTPRGLRCARCGGRAMLERPIGAEMRRPVAPAPEAQPYTPAA